MMNQASKQMAALLRQAGIKAKSVDVYGRQVVVTCWSQATASKVAKLLASAKYVVRGSTQSVDYAKTNLNTSLRPSVVRVTRVFAKVA